MTRTQSEIAWNSGITALLIIILVLSAIPYSFANEENVVLVPQLNSGGGTLTALLQIELDYPQGSSLSKALDGANSQYFQTANITGNASSQSQILRSFNSAFAAANSSVTVSSMNITFRGKVQGDSRSATLTYDIEVRPAFNAIVTGKGHDNTIQIDLNWRKVTVKDPILLGINDLGKVDINHPIGMLHAGYPEIADKIANTSMIGTFMQPVLTFDSFSVPMDKWHSLIDPSFSVQDSQRYRNITAAKLITLYSLGNITDCPQCNQPAEDNRTSTRLEGKDIQVHSYIPPPSGTLTVVGYSQILEGGKSAAVSNGPPQRGPPPAPGERIPLPWLSGVGSLVAVTILVIALRLRQKAKR